MKENPDSANNLEDKLKESLSQIEKYEEVIVPDLAFFEQMVAEETSRNKRQLAKELALFGVIAAAVLFCVAAMLIRLPSVFVILQAPVLIGAILFLYKHHRKEGEWNDT
ncbi:YxlC family protein [Fictibacillus sp. KU28468]|uniref:YxlC family protein n=1 Tax=Fictibacillus sp. KU28468 TaxID=2991053 RepID=UPI00223D1A2A|nr:YxlC family protein [Fictibacillus sp. KU28468]UZJ78072.1 YxlC family protein [Fictibacillus sp. KU28468]